MKKVTAITLVILAYLVFVVPDNAVAQTTTKIGIKSGLTVSNYLDLDTDPDSRLAVNIGAFVEINPANWPISIQPEIFFAMRGAESPLDSGQQIEDELDVNYIDINLLAKYKVQTNSVFTPNLYVGPYLGFEIHNAATGSLLPIINTSNLEPASTDFGGIVGLGTDIDVLGVTLTVDARWNVGLSDAFDNTSGKNSTFAFMGGIAW